MTVTVKRPMLAVLGSLNALALVFAACASGPNATPLVSLAPSPSTFPAAVGGIEGAQWWLIDLDGSAVPASPRIELVMKSGKATGSGGCNSYGGDYAIDGQRIRFSDIASTAMGCLEPGVAEREGAFHRALGDARTWALDARGLSLLDAGGTERAVFESVFGRPAPPSGGPSVATATPSPSNAAAGAPLEGSNWTLIEMDAARLPPDTGIELLMNEGRVEGNGGCNRFGGSYTVTGQELRFSPLAATKMACAEAGRMQREERFFQGLDSARTWSIDGDLLTFRDENEFIRLVFRRTFG